MTNVAIQKTAENYDERTGGKMELQALKLYLMSRYGVERVDALFWEVSPLFALCSPGWTRYVYAIVIHTSLYAVLTLSTAATILL